MPNGSTQYGERVVGDDGPLYVETNLDRIIREPCNAVTAALFVALAAFWLWRMRGRYREHYFMCIAAPILLVGGVGGTIFHAFRRHSIFFYLDVIPIFLLVLMGSIYLWIRIKPRVWHVVLMIAIFFLMQLPFAVSRETHYAIMLHYLSLAALVLTPVAIVQVRTRFRHANLIKLTLVCFGFAILFRFLDPLSAPTMPNLGTHWLWHIFGAITTGLLAEYFYRLETEPIAPLSHPQRTPL